MSPRAPTLLDDLWPDDSPEFAAVAEAWPAATVRAMLQQHAVKGQPIKLSSPICLQNHGSPAWFRNIRIRKL